MFRSHSDRRLMPSISTTPSLGNYMALSSRDGLVTAPCVPGPIQISPNSRARLRNTLVHSQSVPSFSQVPRADEISLALGLQTQHILEYPKPIPVSHYDEMISNLQALTLGDDSADNCASMDTSLSGVCIREKSQASSFDPRSNKSQEQFENPVNVESEADEMSSVEVYSSRPLSTPERLTESADGRAGSKSNHGTIHTGNMKPGSESRKDTSSGFLARISRKRLRTPSRNSTHSRSNSGSPQELVRALMASGISEKSTQVRPETPSKPVVVDMPELQYLVTYNLVNNFYFNLVSWSPVNNSIAIAIESKAYWWDGSSQVRDMNIQQPGLAPVACVSCSSGDAVAVSFSDGYFCVYQVTKRRPPATRQFPSPVQCVEWFPDGKSLMVGDSAGMVALLTYDGLTVQILTHLAGFTQQICGISLNSDCSQVAVGANENLAIVWDISIPDNAFEKCRLRHKSAVKGISFCPWAPSLLATGGGSNDRHLRFWHTGSGTLLQELDTRRQITAVFWSSFYKEIVLTFGFSTTEDYVAAAIYTHPDTHLVAQAVAREPMRALSATMAPDQTKLAIAANDGTVRVFGLWAERPYALTGASSAIAAGSYGSSIVESAEGIDLRGPTVR